MRQQFHNQTFSRTVLTSGIVIVTALILFNLGGTGIRPFAFTFLVGLIAATFSSVAIAAPMWCQAGGGASACRRWTCRIQYLHGLIRLATDRSKA